MAYTTSFANDVVNWMRMDPKKYHIDAYYVGKSLPLAEIEKKNELALVTKRRNSLMFQNAEDRIMVVFSFGVIVLMNFEEKLAKKFVAQISKYAEDPLEKPKVEDYDVLVDPSRKIAVEFESVVLPKIDQEQIHLICEILAQSAAIDFVEEGVNKFVSRFEHINQHLEKTGKIPVSDIEVRKTIGAGRNIVQYIITQLSLLDKPDITWENKEIDTLFTGMRKMFELEDRFKNLEFRINFIQDTSELLLDILATKRGVAMEMAIIYLFVIDIVLVLYELFVK